MIRTGLRWLCALLAAFVLINSLAGLAGPARDASIWVVDVRWLPRWPGTALLIASSLAVIATVLSNRPRTLLAGSVGAAVLAALCAIDVVRFYLLLSHGGVSTAVPLPASALYAAAMSAGAWSLRLPAPRLSWQRGSLAFLSAAAAAALFPVLQMVFFGLTDYRRPADVVLVLGARTYVDGSVSDALSDRVRAACALYRQGLASHLILSGGPGDGPVDEAAAMARLSRDLGVPEEALILDHAGLNTRASVTNTAAICRERGFARVLAVSHFYHLPRIKLEAGRAGLALYTVPAPQGQPLRALPWFMARETAAWWVYWARGRTV
jgi:uncharacterized SAM-binding protein YcdF (DUF218 family)